MTSEAVEEVKPCHHGNAKLVNTVMRPVSYGPSSQQTGRVAYNVRKCPDCGATVESRA